MTRGERIGSLLVASIVGLFVGVLASGFADALGRHGWFSNGANVIQWISGPGTFAAVAVGVAAYLNRTCSASWWCFRHGEHPVHGTLAKVCDHHHTIDHHRAVHAKRAPAHIESGRLERGQSHQG